ncbi:MAG: hypothetical protein N2C14_29755 [Planctomycetales bacterium]
MTNCMMVSTPVPASAQYAEADGLYEVLVYPTPVELMGGAQDGGTATPSFSADLAALRAACCPDSVRIAGITPPHNSSGNR